MIKGMMGMHAQFTISDQTMDLCRENMPEGIGAHIHVAEGIEDLHHCLHNYGKRIVNRLMDHDILGPQTITAHCIYVNQQEMGRLVGVSRQTISQIERGDYSPSVTLAIKIAKIFNARVEDIFDYVEDESDE